MQILNLYAGLGGNRKLWSKEYDITAVEIDPDIAKIYQTFFPADTVVVDDAHQYLLDHFSEFDFIWSSPPCQSHSQMMKATRHKKRQFPDLKLYEEIIFLSHFFKGQFVVENIKPYYRPLIQPTTKIGRHLIWSSYNISDYTGKSILGFINKTNTVAGSERLKTFLGLNYDGNIYYKGNHCPGQVLRNCVHPKLGKHILDCVNIPNQRINNAQLSLF